MPTAYAVVIPAVKTPRHLREFDYAVPDGLANSVTRGSLVVIPWRNRATPGLVVGVRATSEVPIGRVKPLIGLLWPTPLPPAFVDLAEWLPTYCFASPGTTLRALLPSFPKKLLAGCAPEDSAPPTPPPSRTTTKLHLYASGAQKLTQLVALVRALPSDRPALILTPHQDEVAEIASAIKTATGEGQRLVSVTGATGTKSYRDAWQRAASGSPLVVVGTRPAIGLPLTNPAAVIVLETDSRDHRQYDQNPRYDARAVAFWLAEREGAALHLLTQAPRPEDWRLTADDAPPGAPPGAPVVLASSGKGDRADPLSHGTRRRVAEALQNGQKVLIFHNRLGTALAVLCADCGLVLRCPRCRVAYREHGQRLRCHRCGDETAVPTTCAGCGGPRLRSFGPGNASLAAYIKEAFPAARLALFDSTAAAAPDPASTDIVIGGKLALHDLTERAAWDDQFRLAVVTDLDAELGHPGFRVTEQAWRLVTTLRQTIGETGEVVLETLDADNPRLADLLLPAARFLPQELTAREQTGYPPSRALVAVTLAAADGRAGREDLETLRSRLERLASAARLGLRFSPLMQPHDAMRHGRWRWRFAVIGLTPGDPVNEELNRLPERFLVERDPESLT
jgi:primosomal protein N' (replication factor Y)